MCTTGKTWPLMAGFALSGVVSSTKAGGGGGELLLIAEKNFN